ncbi:MAG: ImmA/IrrE family metallo-endopeptidase [Solirubrobacterales bacterium]|nr:ImmA/IrrE family metallo-endopeptidase [Solirubrobacterales bacterium]
MTPEVEHTSIKDEAQQAAEAMLQSTWDNSFPVEPSQIAQKLGVEVVETSLGGEISGALIKTKGRDPVILLNEEDTASRRRFTCAHELGHLDRRTGDLSEFEYIDFRDGTSSTGEVEAERFANAFAANLLMPEDAVREQAATGHNAYDMAQYFGASVLAVRNRLSSLGLPR